MHMTHLIDKRTVAHETVSIRVERPSGFEFSAGQYVDLAVRELPFQDDLGPVRSLTIASAPEDDELEFVMRLRDTAFKHAISMLEPGMELILEGPYDDLGFEARPGRELVFLAAGVGITPFLSVLRQAAGRGDRLDATLFYSNQRPEDAIALDELRGYTERIDGFRLIPTMTRMPESKLEWDGLTGRIDLDLLGRHLPSIVGPVYFLAGTTPFVSELMNALLDAGVEPEDIGVEVFTGY